MLWYVLQTKTGGEEKLVEMICRMVPVDLYGECFVIYHEQLWRRQQQTFVHVKRAFPGYVFITSREPEALFFCLKKVPAMIKMMADEDSFFLSLDPEEARFLRQIMDEHHVIGLSYLETDGRGRIAQVSGPLSFCVSEIVRCRFGRRYVIVRLKLLGKEKEILLGIILKEDICREIKMGKVEVPFRLPKKYGMAWADEENRNRKKRVKQEENQEKDEEEKQGEKRGEKQGEFSVGNVVAVTGGVFCGMSGMVYQVKENVVNIGIRLLGRTIEVEIQPEWLRKV